jgi:hypothetical protein
LEGVGAVSPYPFFKIEIMIENIVLGVLALVIIFLLSVKRMKTGK